VGYTAVGVGIRLERTMLKLELRSAAFFVLTVAYLLATAETPAENPGFVPSRPEVPVGKPTLVAATP